MTNRGHEGRDLNLRYVVLFAGALAVFVVAAHGMVAGLFSGLSGREDRRDRPAPPGSRVDAPPPPRLEELPRAEREALRAREERELGSYGWVDRGRGVVRVPIERAMELLLREEAR